MLNSFSVLFGRINQFTRKTINKITVIVCLALSALILILFPYATYAQELGARLPGGAEAGQATQRLTPAPLVTPKLLKTGVVAPPPKRPPTEAERAAAAIKFKLTQIILTGNTVISTKEIEKVYAKYLNKEISLVDLNNIVQEITRKYRSAGYILSRAILPPQRIHAGIVTIKIIEGYIDKVSVSGHPGRLKEFVQAYGEHAAKDRPLRIKTLERYVLLSDDLPGSTVRAVLTPSKTIPGAADLVMVVELKRLQIDASYDDFGTQYLGPQQITLDTQVNSLFFPGDRNLVRLVNTTDPEEMRFANVDHSQPLNSYGLQWALGASYTDTHPGYLLEPFEIHGISKLFYTGLNQTIVRSRTRDFYAQFLFQYQDNSSTILGEPLYFDRIRSILLNLNYDSTDSLRGANNIMLGAEQGLKILHPNDPGDLLSRANGKNDFTKFVLNCSRLQFIGSRVSLLAAAQGQYALDPLLASEEFTYGGPIFGRGYDPSELTGDMGLAGKLEWRVDTHPNWMLWRTFQFYIFYDMGKVWNIGPDNVQPETQSAISGGGGVRLFFKDLFFMNMYAAKPITHARAADVAGGHNGNTWQWYLQFVVTI